MTSKKYIYDFEEGDGKNKMLLGGKGANLCEMTQIGLNVPPGFTITTEACLAYLEKNQLPGGPDGRHQGAHAGAGKEDRQGLRQRRRIRCWFRCVPVRPCPCRA